MALPPQAQPFRNFSSRAAVPNPKSEDPLTRRAVHQESSPIQLKLIFTIISNGQNEAAQDPKLLIRLKMRQSPECLALDCNKKLIAIRKTLLQAAKRKEEIDPNLYAEKKALKKQLPTLVKNVLKITKLPAVEREAFDQFILLSVK